MWIRRRVIAALFLTLLASTPISAFAQTSGQQRSQAYWNAVQYLSSHGAEVGWRGGEAQSVLLGEGVGANPIVVGPRSTTLLSSLELVSPDARGRRAAVLAPLGVDVAADRGALLAMLRVVAPDPVAGLVTPTFVPALPGPIEGGGFGENDTRMPVRLDNALALQGIAASGVAVSGADMNSVTAAILYLLINQIPPGQSGAGGWRRLDYGDATNGGTAADVAVTAQVALALASWNGVFNTNDSQTAAAVYLKSTSPVSSSDRALRVLALLAKEPTASETQAAVDQLVTTQPSGGGYDGSVYATALAARALLRASAFGPYFDRDGDGIRDELDPDADGDGYCAPPAVTPTCPLDAFPLDALEHADLDLDGLGDSYADFDDDGDGVADLNEPAFAANALESRDSDHDGTGDNADIDDDQDHVTDVEEILLGLDPLDPDSDNDSFSDEQEIAANTDGLDPNDYTPDGDVHPLGAPDGVVDLGDAVLATRVSTGRLTLSQAQQDIFQRHADVAPLSGGVPMGDGSFDAADALLIMRRASGASEPWW
jgi:hypothetical protein